jgi:hypothetical protein
MEETNLFFWPGRFARPSSMTMMSENVYFLEKYHWTLSYQYKSRTEAAASTIAAIMTRQTTDDLHSVTEFLPIKHKQNIKCISPSSLSLL